MMTIGITGGTGFVGRYLSRLLTAAGHRVIVFSRSKKPDEGAIRFQAWNPDRQEMETALLKEIDAVIHLAGADVADQRWTASRKKEILSSRIAATNFLLGELQRHAPRCKTFIAASATGYYGPDRGGQPFTENDTPFDDFLAQVCVEWEAASAQAASLYRTAIFRFGIVLGRDGGAYPKLAGPMKFGMVPILGGGRQIVSWIHVEDVARMIGAALEDDRYSGIYNAVAPAPVPHLILMKTLAKAKGGIRIPVRVPPFILRLILGEASIEVLKSCTASAKKLTDTGFSFRYPVIADAAAQLTRHAG